MGALLYPRIRLPGSAPTRANSRCSLNLFPHFREAVPVDAQIPFAEITKWRQPNRISRRAQPFGDLLDQFFRKIRRRGAAEMRKGMKHDVLQRALVGKPFDMLQRLAQHGGAPLPCFVRSFGVEKHHDGFLHRLVDLAVRNLRQRLRMRLPAKAFRLKAEKLHRSTRLTARACLCKTRGLHLEPPNETLICLPSRAQTWLRTKSNSASPRRRFTPGFLSISNPFSATSSARRNSASIVYGCRSRPCSGRRRARWKALPC